MAIIQRYWWLIILTLGLLLRIVGLNLNPIGLAHDEVHDIINAKSMALTGVGAPGTVAGILPSSGYCDGNCVFGELGTIILAPWMKISPMNMLMVKIPFLIASLLIMWLGGKLFENISGDKTIGKLTGLFIAISPWAIHFGRTAYENLFAYALFLGSLCLWTKRKSGNKEAFWGTILGLLASLSYFGAKALWPPLMLVGIFYWKINSKRKWKEMIGWWLITLLLLLGYWVLLGQSVAGVRTKELKLDTNEISTTVNEERRMSLEIPLGMERVISNKMVTKVRTLGQKYLNLFSVKYFLSDSESSYDNFSIPGHGYVYILEIGLAVFGLVYLYQISVKGWWFLLLLFLIMPIPGAINNNAVTYALRSGMIFPLISGLGAIGIYGLNKIIRKNNIVYYVVGFGLIISLIYFEILYWYRMPFEKSTGYVFYERAAVNYVSLLRKETEKSIFWVVNEPVDIMYNYAFYTGKYNNKKWIEKMNASILSGNYEIDGIKISKRCPSELDKESIYIFERERGCVGEPNDLTRISEPRDGGARFFVIEDIMCNTEKLNSYPNPRKITDFNIEKMDKKEFCQKWISKPAN